MKEQEKKMTPEEVKAFKLGLIERREAQLKHDRLIDRNEVMVGTWDDQGRYIIGIDCYGQPVFKETFQEKIIEQRADQNVRTVNVDTIDNDDNDDKIDTRFGAHESFREKCKKRLAFYAEENPDDEEGFDRLFEKLKKEELERFGGVQ